MDRARRLAAVAVPALLIAGLGGCSLIDPGSTQEPLSGIAACALGNTWNLDTAALAEQVGADLARQSVAVTDITAAGSQTLDWQVDGDIVMDSDYTVSITTAPAADQAITVTDTHRGRAEGVAYINAEVAIPRDWDSTGVSVETVGQLNGAPLEAIPFRVANVDLDDSVGIELTCDGSTLTTHARGGDITLRWTK